MDQSKQKIIEEVIRVNQAGEYGATRIYAGQRAILGIHDQTLTHMAEQEEEHLKKFNQLAIEHKVRPTFLQPLWHVGGFALGVITAFMGRDTAHACTIAVETVIDEHYQNQLKELKDVEGYQDLKNTIHTCHLDEIAHRDYAIAEGGEEAKGYTTLTGIIKSITKTAIFLSKRV